MKQFQVNTSLKLLNNSASKVRPSNTTYHLLFYNFIQMSVQDLNKIMPVHG